MSEPMAEFDTNENDPAVRTFVRLRRYSEKALDVPDPVVPPPPGPPAAVATFEARPWWWRRSR